MSGLSFWIDESEKGNLLVVGGILIPFDQIPTKIYEWRSMKQKFGLDAFAEIKWTLPPNHPTRTALEQKGLKTVSLLEDSINLISKYPKNTCLVAIMCDMRDLNKWKQQWKDASVRDFYCAGIKMILQRVAEECVEQNEKLSIIVCDEPGLGKKNFVRGSIKRGCLAIEDAFKEWYEKGVGPGPSEKYFAGPLRDIILQPSPLRGHAKFHDILQIADVMVGATRDWVAKIKQGENKTWVVEQIKKIKETFRQKHGKPDFWGDGLILWPYDPNLWNHLKKSLDYGAK